MSGGQFTEECDSLKTAEFDEKTKYENLHFINSENRLILMEDAMTQIMQQMVFLEMERDVPKDIDSNLLYIIF